MLDYNWSDKTILIVEDNIINFRFLELALKSTQINIIHVTNGQEAIKICRSNSNLDLILMDIQLPEMSGYETTENIRTFNTTIPIIAQTGHEAEEDLQKCLDAGCNDYMRKPIITEQLIKVLHTYFE